MRFTGLPQVSFKNFQDAFEALLTRIKNEKIVVVIDEFGYLARKDSGILSEFQEIVDNMLKDKKIMLILCGSSISMMETAVLGHGSPLYGRTTRYMKIEPFDYPTMRLWYPEAKIEDLVKIYAVTSGVARYLEFFTGQNTEKEIARNFFDSSSFMFGDATRLLSDELRDYSTYIQVLEGISPANLIFPK